MRLFVWTEYAPDYSNGLAFAIAEDSEQARDMIAEINGYRSDSLAESPQVFELTEPIAFAQPGGG